MAASGKVEAALSAAIRAPPGRHCCRAEAVALQVNADMSAPRNRPGDSEGIYQARRSLA